MIEEVFGEPTHVCNPLTHYHYDLDGYVVHITEGDDVIEFVVSECNEDDCEECECGDVMQIVLADPSEEKIRAIYDMLMRL